jgi:glutamate/tyrosine decarboxylase-like PLP-dependent enzyme
VDVDERGGFPFVRDPALMHGTFALTGAPYLPEVSAERPSYGDRGPAASRRARALAVWATLKAYGRAGYRAMVDRQDDADLIARVTSELGGRLPAAT